MHQMRFIKKWKLENRMGLKNNFLLTISAIMLIFLAACSSQKRVSRKDLKGGITELINRVDENEVDFDTFSAKANFSIKSEKRNKSFKANIRIKNDSAIWISITPLFGIEVARVMITQDTVKVINRINKEYFIGDYTYINKRFNVELEFETIQSILLGNSIPFELTEALKFATDKSLYYLGNMKKRKARKVDGNPRKVERKNEEVISLWISSMNFRVKKFILSDLAADRFIMGEYSDYNEINEQLIPQKLNFHFQGDTPTVIEIDYSRVSLDKSLNFSFNISSKYEQVVY